MRPRQSDMGWAFTTLIIRNMKKKLEQAIKSADVAEVRNILLEMVSSKGGSVTMIEEMAHAIGSTENLFDKDDGKIYANSAKELTQTQIDALREDVKRNFSIPKFKLLAEVQEIERTHPSYFKERVKDVTEEIEYADGSSMTVEEHIVDDEMVNLEAADNDLRTPVNDSEKVITETGKETSANIGQEEDEPKKKSAGKLFGYILLLTGLAVSIVGLCVSVNFLLGLGIGIMMIGAGTVYVSLSR